MKTLQAILILGLSLSSCGREDSEEPSLAESPSSESGKQTLLSIALKSREDLPTCDDNNKKQLAYLLDEKIFLVCDNSDWVEVQIKGSDGERGIAGEKGETGEQGIAGESGEAGESVTNNMWYDGVTGKHWIIGSDMFWPLSNGGVNNPCTSPFRIPTKAEAKAAALRGMWLIQREINGPDTIWTSDEIDTNNAWVINLNGVQSPSELQVAKLSFNGAYCIEE